jgi:hypothetical protein
MCKRLDRHQHLSRFCESGALLAGWRVNWVVVPEKGVGFQQNRAPLQQGPSS